MKRILEFRVRASQSRPGMRHRQRGMTTLGFIILAVFIGLFAFAAVRLTPVYLNYIKVAGVVEGVFEEFDGQNPSSAMIKNSIIRRFSVESVSELEPRDISVKPESNGFRVTAEYDHTVPYIANVSFTVHFRESRLVRR